MLNLITGVPGTCKTAYVVTQLDKVERENKLNLQKNKSIYLHNRPIFEKYRNDFSYFEVESGSGHELKTDLELLSDDYFDFLNEDYDDLRPDFYFLRSTRYNEIIERIHERDGEQGFKLFQPVRTIYTNIKSLKIDYVRALTYDWRDCPDGSIVLIDEVQLVEPYSDLKQKHEIVQHLTIHRHRGFDFYFITQAPSLLHPTVKELIGCHRHLTKPYGGKTKIYQFGSCRAYPNTLVNKLNCETSFRFNPQSRIFKLYKSTTINTHKARIPKQLLSFSFLIVAAICFSVYFLVIRENNSSFSLFGTSKKEEAHLIQSTPTPTKKTLINDEKNETKKQLISVEQEEQQRIAMIIESSNDCYAKNSNGEFIDISVDECRKLSTKNVRIQFSKIKKPHLLDNQSLNQVENERTADIINNVNI
ncbi:zonular occludens toxin domain-containing protein [Acinetobacter baumannii]|uniref:zonular occludens toxin domain-containing protein n=1 Tax=Acinetobacter baumannii TaxID=470 RepID=UPI00244941AD|nr:zonular occludens toxin domain-containing protein [Acinetobacter baumannii]MDH2601869.1 zonular occludens toxin domain-containing protein [Acinetobacter baumannii]